jgi:DNA-directed RNA polymerase subunit L
LNSPLTWHLSDLRSKVSSTTNELNALLAKEGKQQNFWQTSRAVRRDRFVFLLVLLLIAGHLVVTSPFSRPHPVCNPRSLHVAATMAARKTQQEIEKTFKKVAEGIATFESIYDKIKTATNTAQRDKLEENLKREIKKLQRFRDQIKSWAAGNEVKDKTPLLEQRRNIETVRLQLDATECLPR